MDYDGDWQEYEDWGEDECWEETEMIGGIVKEQHVSLSSLSEGPQDWIMSCCEQQDLIAIISG